MKLPPDTKKLLEQEISYYDSFTNKITTDYGKIYYNPFHPSSWDSNHAHILDINGNIELVLQNIIRFYRGYKLIPRVYMSFIDNEIEKLQPHFKSHGFTMDIYTNEFMVYPTREARIIESPASIRRITQLSDDIVELIHTEESGDWSINVLNTSIKDDRFHLLGLFQSNKCLSIASIRIMDSYSRIDDVKTHKEFRGRHYGTQLILYLANYHSSISDNCLYLWAHNPIALRLYKNVGFQKIMVNTPCWDAHLAE